MSLLDSSNSARPVGGLGIGPREDYRPPVTYRRGMETSAPANVRRATVSKTAACKAAACKAASISTEARSCPREADTVLPVGNPATHHTGKARKKSQAARVMDAVRSGARNTTEITRCAGLVRTDTVKTISALIKKKMLLDLPHPPGTDRCVMLGVSAGFPVESPVSGASPDALPQTPIAPCDIHEKDEKAEKGEKGEKGEKADEWNHWSDQDAPGSIEPEEVMPLPYASVEQGESGESSLLEEMDRMITRHQKDMNIMAALVGRLRRIHEADSEEQGEQGAMAELIRVRKALRDLIA